MKQALDHRPQLAKLKAVCILGLAIFLLLLGGLAFLLYYTGWNDPSEQGNFFQELRKFDALLLETPERLTPRRLNPLLDRLEKRASAATAAKGSEKGKAAAARSAAFR
ncbi:hypothetical protein AGMMS49940_16770 [Spirochaetia bacterium]|nr:hypothetical protein AGMMS49940_16770 [Spirochaetia bacterium]